MKNPRSNSETILNNKSSVRDMHRNETVMEIIDHGIEKEIKNVLMVEHSEPSCSWNVMSPAKETSKSEPTINASLCNISTLSSNTPEPSVLLPSPKSTTAHECFSRHIGLTNDLCRSNVGVNHFSSSPPLSISEPTSETAPPVYPEDPSPNSHGIHVINIPDRTIIEALPKLMGPPPSYSKSFLDRRINHCASIQFVAPIPPPSYDGMDNELRYDGYSSGFTLGLGNTWQSQPQPAYCPVCETVIITQVDIRVSKVAYIFSIVMFFILCWPCCFLPYFLNVCNFTYHYCSVCHCYLGARRPFQRN